MGRIFTFTLKYTYKYGMQGLDYWGCVVATARHVPDRGMIHLGLDCMYKAGLSSRLSYD